MFIWLRRLLAARKQAPRLPEDVLPGGSPPAWAGALLEAVQKSSRAQARLALHVEDLDRKLEGGLAELRGALSSQQRGAVAPAESRWDELLDALDLLDESAHVADSALAPGLAGVAARLERFLGASGLTRLAPLGHPPDGRLFRVVGTQPHSHLPEGAIARVVRAAALRGEQLVREGEVITVRNSP
jgi:molecular chaperone GrpE (heat shock protein)